MLWISLSAPTLMTFSCAWTPSENSPSTTTANSLFMETSLGPVHRKGHAMGRGAKRPAFRTKAVRPALQPVYKGAYLAGQRAIRRCELFQDREVIVVRQGEELRLRHLLRV